MGPEEGFNALNDKYENLVTRRRHRSDEGRADGAAERRVHRFAHADDRSAGVGDSRSRLAKGRPLVRAAWAGCTDACDSHAGLDEEARGDGRTACATPVAETPESPPGRAMAGKYLLLYKYLENRYANRVVLTFAEIEDLLGFALPGQARLHRSGGRTRRPTSAGSPHSDSWILARRTAVPNMLAHTVAFERG